MKNVSLNLSYNKQRLYRNILIDLGLVSKDAKYGDYLQVVFTESQFVAFVAAALANTEVPFSLRAMGFRAFEVEENPQQELPLNQEEEPSAKRGEDAIMAMLETLFGVPVIKIDGGNLPPINEECGCPACTLGVTLEEALRGNLRATQMSQNQPSKRDAGASPVFEAKYGQEQIDDLHEKALAWNKKVDDATKLAFEQFYVMRQGDVSIWQAWRFLEKNEGRVMWPEFIPNAAYKGMPLRNVWAMAQNMRSSLLEYMTP